MYEILSKEEERINLYDIDLEIVERIVSHKNIVIKTEDQLLEFINSLYKINHESGFLYQYASLSHCSLESLQTFLSEFFELKTSMNLFGMKINSVLNSQLESQFHSQI